MTKKLTCGAKWSPFPPHCSGGSTYRVLIPTPSQSKIRSIARYKRSQIAVKRAQEAASVHEGVGVGVSNSSVSQERNATVEATRVVLQTPSIGIVVPANKMQSVSNENIQRELAGIDRNYLLIRREMNSLTSVRTSLLWLLKKSTQLETSINSAPVA